VSSQQHQSFLKRVPFCGRGLATLDHFPSEWDSREEDGGTKERKSGTGAGLSF
jgi:hypothetical protein